MHRYELDLTDEQADAIYRMARGHHDFGVSWAEQFKALIPIPVPTKIAAVVRTVGSEHGSSWCLVYANPASWATPSDPSGHLYRTDQIGRIAEVLSEGVDL